MSPAKGQTTPDSLRQQLIDWFTAHPGYYRPMQVAESLGIPTGPERRKMTNECARLAREGVILRLNASAPGRTLPITTYGAPAPKQKRTRRT